MRKYLTWRCMGLHALVVVLVPLFCLAGWWQYRVALGGNDLSWVYTVEWPFFAVYAVYIWWRLIHDEGTPFDRLWAAKQRAAADAEGRPLHDIPGWAMDKTLARDVYRASIEAARHPTLAAAWPEIGSLQDGAADLMPAAADRRGLGAPASRVSSPECREADPDGHLGEVVDAQVLQVKSSVDDELDAYNRYLFGLSRSGSEKRWSSRRHKPQPRRPIVGETAERAVMPASGAELPYPAELPAGDAG
jgi:hypothetical protein